jgi:hypothetical protein
MTSAYVQLGCWLVIGLVALYRSFTMGKRKRLHEPRALYLPDPDSPHARGECACYWTVDRRGCR